MCIQHDRACHRRLDDEAPGDAELGAKVVRARGKDNAADGCVGECTGQAGNAAHHGPRRIGRWRRKRRRGWRRWRRGQRRWQVGRRRSRCWRQPRTRSEVAKVRKPVANVLETGLARHKRVDICWSAGDHLHRLARSGSDADRVYGGAVGFDRRRGLDRSAVASKLRTLNAIRQQPHHIRYVRAHSGSGVLE